jgi:hypothetical protein
MRAASEMPIRLKAASPRPSVLGAASVSERALSRLVVANMPPLAVQRVGINELQP